MSKVFRFRLKKPKKEKEPKTHFSNGSTTMSVSTRITSRMRGRAFTMPSYSMPDWRSWRKGKVGSLDKEKVPTEWELEQMVLKDLQVRRQQCLAQRQMELISLKQRVLAESMDQLNSDISTPTQSESDQNDRSSSEAAYFSSPRPRTAWKTPSESLQNLDKSRQIINNGTQIYPVSLSSSHPHPQKHPHLSKSAFLDAQRRKRLEQVRIELEEFKAIHFQGNLTDYDDDDEEEDGESNGELHSISLGNPRVIKSTPNFTTTTSTSSSDDNTADNEEVLQAIRRQRESQLKKLRQENLILQFRIREEAAA